MKTYGEMHVPTKTIPDDGTIFGGPMQVTCSCGRFYSDDTKRMSAMDQFRDHYASGATQDPAPKPHNSKQRTQRSRLK